MCDQSGRERLKAYTRAKLVQHLDASKGTELVLNSSWHFTGSQVHVIGIPEKHDQVQCLLDPLRPPHPLDRPGGEGLAARLTCPLPGRLSSRSCFNFALISSRAFFSSSFCFLLSWIQLWLRRSSCCCWSDPNSLPC